MYQATSNEDLIANIRAMTVVRVQNASIFHGESKSDKNVMRASKALEILEKTSNFDIFVMFNRI